MNSGPPRDNSYQNLNVMDNFNAKNITAQNVNVGQLKGSVIQSNQILSNDIYIAEDNTGTRYSNIKTDEIVLLSDIIDEQLLNAEDNILNLNLTATAPSKYQSTSTSSSLSLKTSTTSTTTNSTLTSTTLTIKSSPLLTLGASEDQTLTYHSAPSKTTYIAPSKITVSSFSTLLASNNVVGTPGVSEDSLDITPTSISIVKVNTPQDPTQIDIDTESIHFENDATISSTGGITLESGSNGIVWGNKNSISQQTSINTNVNINGNAGFITTVTTTLAAQSATSFTVNNTFCKSSSIIFTEISGYTGTLFSDGIPNIILNSISNGSFVISVANFHATNPLNGTITFAFFII